MDESTDYLRVRRILTADPKDQMVSQILNAQDLLL